MLPVNAFAPAEFPQSRAELHVWIHRHLKLSMKRESALMAAVDAVFTRHTELAEKSKEEALQALCAGLADKMARVQLELSARDATLSSISHHFEQLVAEVMNTAHYDRKTRVMNFARFNEQIESMLAFEQRGRWCALGLADIRRFQWYKDALGDAVGDQIIERMARLLRGQVRADDPIATDAAAQTRHTRFGGGEFWFLISRLQEDAQAAAIGARFRDAVTQYNWTFEDHRLAAHPVLIDVGLVCVWLGKVAERRFVARRLAADLIQRADKLRYDAKGEQMSRIHFARLGIKDGTLVALTDLNRLPADSSS